MDSDVNIFATEWIEDHEEKSSENYDPYAHVYDVDLLENGSQEILEDFDWTYDE